MIQIYISPNYTHKKLEPPFFRDQIDVFEDRIRHWLIEPAKTLLKHKHGKIPAVFLVINYIEGIEIYISGEDSKNKSKDFFKRGYKRIFASVSGEDYMQDAVAEGLYEMLRCGFAHDAMFRDGIYFSDIRKEAMFIDWPKINGKFDSCAKLKSVVINPARFIECIEIHFDFYLKELKSIHPNVAQENFKKAVKLKWPLAGTSRLIDVTEDEFYAAR
ncbi:hypothetical protein SAMN02949497_1539 [Methylomagnum ishizawai]|uniref:Uncharacterized protein n=1 Tax=Methylomagnum ishizawai TaxID=1760988 RepID=A0A1Y6CVI1_9GAMM|nr:hypothetical protein [Methylomagnum ishizawai]SMF94230.1 hypothetical protein SAMN02949497_1539 [Methylomagnum ishizawai]